MGIDSHPVALTPECRLVYLTAGGHPNDRAVAALATNRLDWGRALVIAEREHALASLGRALQHAAPGDVPADILAYLRKRTMVSDFRMLRLEQRLLVTLEKLRAANVDVMLLKGAAFGATIYGSFAERSMIDVDLLVHREDIARASEAIVAAGWQASTDPVLADLLSDHHHLPAFLDPESMGLRLELHNSLLPQGHPFGLHDADIWNASVDAGPRFHGARVPSRKHLLYHASVHFAWSHAMQAGAWRTFRDANELLRSDDFDWDDFVDLALGSRAASACYWMLRLSHRLSGLKVPEEVFTRLSSPTPEFVRLAVERHFISIVAPGEGPPCPSSTLARLLWRAAIRPAWSGHGRRAPWVGEKNWELARFGVRPDSVGARAVRHLTGVRHWWNYVMRTLVPLA